MTNEQILFESEAREKLRKGVDAVANAVKVTMGANGRNVVLANGTHNPHVTKDGVSVANHIEIKSDEIENTGASIIKSAAINTVRNAGDGTTTATVLTQVIVHEGFKAIAAGANPMHLKRGIDFAVSGIVKALEKISKPVSGNDVLDIATISANSDKEIGGFIAEAMNRVW